MKYIGHSYGRCVADIYEGRIKYDDIAVIIARTKFDPLNRQQWESIWYSYTHYDGLSADHWMSYADNDEVKEELYQITVMLHNDGLLHQPRNFGANSVRYGHAWSKIEPVDYEDIQQNELEKWDSNKKSTLSDEDLNLLLGAMI